MTAIREMTEHPARIASPGAMAGAESITPADLAELMARFEEAARALQGTHETLRGEVHRLERELGETKGQLRRAQDLAALGEMAAGIAHEIRNPLGSIRLYAEALVEDLADRPNERTIASKVARAVDSLNAVVTDVLAFSRDIRVCAEVVDAGDLLGQAVESCAAVIASTGTRVRIELGDPVEIRCDASLLHQALVNVLRNACEAAGEHARAPTVVLSTLRRTMLGGDGKRVSMRALRVVDNGPGVPPEVRERMFNPFFTTRHTGTGLGLAIVHRILDAHAGRVDIQTIADDPGASGAVVDLLLPEETAHRPPKGDQP